MPAKLFQVEWGSAIIFSAETPLFMTLNVIFTTKCFAIVVKKKGKIISEIADSFMLHFLSLALTQKVKKQVN